MVLGFGCATRVARFAAIGMAIALLSGCNPVFRINPEPQMEGLPVSAKSPLHAGVYYSPHFADHEQARVSGSNTWVVPIGAASVKLFDDLFPRVFEKATRVSQLSEEELRAKGVDLVVAPSLVHFDFLLGGDADSARYSVAYRITLYTTRGVPAASWIVTGNAPPASSFSMRGGVWALVEDDMKDAAAKFLNGFQREAGPALAAIANRGKEGSQIDPRQVSLSTKRSDFSGLDPKLGEALGKAGMVAIRLAAESSTERGLVVRGSDTRLRLKDGRTIEPATVSTVLSALDQTSQDGAMVGALVNPLIGVLVNMQAQRAQQEEREGQFRAVSGSLFQERLLSPGKEEAGNIVFRLPKGTTIADAAGLTVWIVDPAAAGGAQVEIPLQTTP